MLVLKIRSNETTETNVIDTLVDARSQRQSKPLTYSRKNVQHQNILERALRREENSQQQIGQSLKPLVAAMLLIKKAFCSIYARIIQPFRYVDGTNLNSELYYKIKCEPERGYCLHVGNCTVSGDGPGQQAYPIIDQDGCTKEPSLFEHVQLSRSSFIYEYAHL
uniref:ZP domain-containing protein n=1 Tax=Parascaris equorum TaxID=6256 RepID=A0A914RUF2_PAREQ